MENWGLITGRTSVYLYDEKKSGIAAKKRVIGVQSHEVRFQTSRSPQVALGLISSAPSQVSHQWFGNIVTFHWWDNLWLNEAFATLIGEVIMIDLIEPEWQVQSSFISEHLARAFSLDALRSSHPIEVSCSIARLDCAHADFFFVFFFRCLAPMKIPFNKSLTPSRTRREDQCSEC